MYNLEFNSISVSGQHGTDEALRHQHQAEPAEVGRPHSGVVPPPRRRNPARLHPELDPVQEEELPGRQALRHVEPRRQDLQRFRERHFFGHLLLPETHGHGVGEGPEDVDPRLSVAGRRNPRTLRRH